MYSARQAKSRNAFEAFRQELIDRELLHLTSAQIHCMREDRLPHMTLWRDVMHLARMAHMGHMTKGPTR
ncbi:putative protein OS=Streptomyces fumanus OX=67302 GN=GCM10018772_09560 PE=4 SV=1 [Streptomyces fumanus]|uniref:Uncharacterized protein n=1 Tax=Streptomyces fumanus TaxID=67302 RepID=A0A919DXI7_9ACTN|nr:hypothetical protein GCM10018772_09560 [Streptomyces fumanus]